MNHFPILSVLTATPIAGALLLFFMPASEARVARRWALAFSIAGLCWAALLWVNFDSSRGDLQFVEQHDWITDLGAQYFLGFAVYSGWCFSRLVP